MALRVRSDLHLSRRFFHFLGVSAFIYLYETLSYPIAIKASLAFCVVTVIGEIARFKIPFVNRLLITSVGEVMRKQEIRNVTGITYLAFGGFVVIYLFPRPITTLALLMFAVGDPASSIFGILYGKDKIVRNKTLQGAIAGFIACSIASFIYFNVIHSHSERTILMSLVCGAIGTIAELIPVGKLDDNFTFPVISASLLWILSTLLGGAL